MVAATLVQHVAQFVPQLLREPIYVSCAQLKVTVPFPDTLPAKLPPVTGVKNDFHPEHNGYIAKTQMGDGHLVKRPSLQIFET